MICEKPVLLITFNRPETTLKILESIALVKPKKLYVFSDAPRINNSEDILNVEKVRDLISKLNWEMDLKMNYQAENLGCARAVTSAIDWVFQSEDMVIILEDDCMPNESFFKYCETMLELYKNNEQVMHISGTRWNLEFKIEASHFFSSIGHVWGWATWKNSWSKYDYNVHNWNIKKKLLKTLKRRVYVQYWSDLFKYISIQEDKHTWDYQWQYTLFRNKGLAVVPNCNMISNIGFQGAHTSIVEDTLHSNYIFKAKCEDWIYDNKKIEIKQNIKYDMHHMKNHFLKYFSFLRKIKLLLKYYFGK